MGDEVRGRRRATLATLVLGEDAARLRFSVDGGSASVRPASLRLVEAKNARKATPEKQGGQRCARRPP